MPLRNLPRESYTVGIICALAVEKAAVEATLDEEHGGVGKTTGDENSYNFGRIGEHNVVVASLPAGMTGKAPAAVAARDMMRSFPIKAGFMVGIGGGVWSEKADVRLGDVVVSQPDGMHGGVVQWDSGKMEREGVFRRTGTLNKPPRPLLNAVQSLKARHMRCDSEVEKHLKEMWRKYPRMAKQFQRPGRLDDRLFTATYAHDNGIACDGCDPSQTVRRAERDDDAPQIHYGNIASGDEVMKDGPTRDRIAQEEGILCFEMEAAGLMDSFPCVVIRGICDYADSHKNKQWQPYAAATAACYCKELLGVVGRQGILELELAILWLDGSSRNALRQSLASAAQTLPVDQGMIPPQPHLQAHDIDGSLDKLWRWLSKKGNTGWLLIFDNVDRDWQIGKGDAQAYNPTEFFPSADHGAVLITSRLTRIQGPQSSLHLRQADHELGKRILETRARKGLPGTFRCSHVLCAFALWPSSLISTGGADAHRLIQRLGGLPLALVQAGAYLQQTGMTVDEYLECYASTWEDLMANQNRFPLHEYGERGVLTTWRMSYEQVCAVKPEAARLLDQWAFLHPEDIWYDMVEACFTASAQASMPYDGTSTAPDKLSFWDSLHILAQYSLVSATGSSNSFAIHPVVHDWSLHNITDQTMKEQLSATAIRAIAKCIPQSGSADEHLTARRLLPHSRMAGGRYVAETQGEDLTHELYFFAYFMQDWESSQVVEGLYLQALRGYEEDEEDEEDEETWELKHTSTLNTVNNLGDLYRNQGKMKDAEDMFLRALTGYEETWGPKHTSTLNTVNSLANLYYGQGKMHEAEQMYLRALTGYEEALGPKHTSTLNTVNNLGLLYAHQGEMKDAEEMYLRALTGYEEALGPKHTSTLRTVNNLAVLYSRQGKMHEAEHMYLRALTGYEEALGPKHTSTLDTVHNLANLYSDQGKMHEAEQMYLRVLTGREEALGPKHTSTLKTVNNLGLLYAHQGKMKEAEEMYLRALTGYEEALGPKHTSTLNTVNNLAVLYSGQGKMHEAEHMYLRALTGYEEALGPKHTSTLDTVNNLATLYYGQGKMHEAEQMYLRALTGYEEALGPKHTSTLSIVNNLGNLYADQGKMKDAEEMYLRALTGREEAWGPKHTSTLDTVYCLGGLYRQQHRIPEAVAMYRRALSGYEQVEEDRETYVRYVQNELLVMEVGGRIPTPSVTSLEGNADPVIVPQSPLPDPSTSVANRREAHQSDRTARKRDFVMRMFRKR
ncbi:hypothetical protein LTR17_006133 [Elasticomyces elasticus]|nr:hypothetical protein LTR17_006133 [Elasticomyces elasticus]